jgi:hypothetical protein
MHVLRNILYLALILVVLLTPVLGVRVTASIGPPPTCILTGVIAGPPKQIQITVQAANGLQAITVTSTTNGVISVPAFTIGTTSPIVLTATKIDQSKPFDVAIKVSDVPGLSTTCDFNDNPVTSVPEFPLGLVVLVGIAIPMLIVLRSRYTHLDSIKRY